MAAQEHQEDGNKFVPDENNALQKHAFFFDRNQDGIIYPWETFQGCRAIGCGFALSTVASILINGAFSQKSRPGKSFSPLLPIEIKNIQKSKHGSDTGVYDNEGRFVADKFEAIFSKYAHSHGSALSSEELMEMLKGNREPKDYAGWVSAWIEWKVLFHLCKDRKGLLQRDTLRGVYDGSLFEKMEKERKIR